MYRYFTSVNFFKCPGGHMVISKPLTGLIFSCLVYRRSYGHQKITVTGLIFSYLVYRRSFGYQQITHQSYIFLFSVQTVILSLVDHLLVLHFLVQCSDGHMVISRPLISFTFSCLVYRRSYGHQQTTYQSYIFLFSVQTVIWSSVDHSPVLHFLVQCSDGHMVISRLLTGLLFPFLKVLFSWFFFLTK